MTEKKTSRSQGKNALGIVLVLSLILNIALAVSYSNLARQQNTAWSNGTAEVAKVAFWLIDDYRENPSSETLAGVSGHIQMLFQQLQFATLLPYGQDIIPFATIQKVNSFLNYEQRVIALMQTELKENGAISEDNRKRWQVINQGWQAMFALLQEENNKTDPFRPVFLKQVWQQIWAEATKALDQVEPMPLPN